MLILHVSDTHLGAMPSGSITRGRDVYEAFLETIDIALREHVDIYIHTGDFFNTASPPPEAYVVAYRGLKKLKDRGVKVIAIAGQHDLPKRYALSPLAILKDVGVIDYLAIDSATSFDLNVKGFEVSFACVPYSARRVIPSLPRPTKRSVLMAHLLLKELGIPSSDADISLDVVPQGFSYIALGDYHNKTVFRHRSGTPAVYPGATEVHRVNEYGKKYVVLVDMSKSDAVFDFLELQTVRPWLITSCSEISLCVKEVLDNARKILQDRKKKPVVYIYIEKVRADLLSRYLDEMTAGGIIEFYTIEDSEKKEGSATAKEQQSLYEELEHIDIKAMLKDLLGDEELAMHLLSLLENPSKHEAEELVNYLRNNLEKLKGIELRLNDKLLGGCEVTQNEQQRVAKTKGRLL